MLASIVYNMRSAQLALMHNVLISNKLRDVKKTAIYRAGLIMHLSF